MRWDRFFEDLEDQLDSEWEAERAALDTEAERLRLSRVTLRERMRALDSTEVGVEVAGGSALSGRIVGVGADWVALEHGRGSAIVPLDSIVALSLPHDHLLRSARPAASDRPSVADRMTLGFVLRDIARRRIPVTVQLSDARAFTGTVDRGGADHLDLALHEPGAPRRASEVRGHRIVPFAAIAWVQLDAGARLPLG